jgi:hypothetical protein
VTPGQLLAEVRETIDARAMREAEES